MIDQYTTYVCMYTFVSFPFLTTVSSSTSYIGLSSNVIWWTKVSTRRRTICYTTRHRMVNEKKNIMRDFSLLFVKWQIIFLFYCVPCLFVGKKMPSMTIYLIDRGLFKINRSDKIPRMLSIVWKHYHLTFLSP